MKREPGNEVSISEVAQRLGLLVKTESSSSINAYCPLCESQQSKSPSFWIAKDQAEGKPAGMWVCHSCGKKGDVVSLYGAVKRLNRKDSYREFCEEFGVERETDKAAPRKKAGPKNTFPTMKKIESEHRILLKSDAAMQHWTQYRAWTKEFIEDAKIGLDGKKLRIPILSREGNLLNYRLKPFVKEDLETGAKTMGHKGRPCNLYPLHLFNFDMEAVICEGEPDAGALHSIGVNGITYTGGVDSLKLEKFKEVIPAGTKGCVTIVLDNGPKVKRIEVRLRRELLDAGIDIVKVIRLPDNVSDIEEHLREFAPEKRLDEWHRLIEAAGVFGKESMQGDLWIEDGALCDEDGREVAPFTGEIKTWGKMRGQGALAPAVFVYTLRHKNGKSRDVHIDPQKDDFSKSVAAQCGPEWSFLSKNSDVVQIAINGSTGADAPQKDSGFIFGFDDEDLETFWTPKVSFTQDGPFNTDELVDMVGPSSFHSKFGLPAPNRESAKVAMAVVLKDLFYSHAPQVMGPMIAAAFCAPIRRKHMPEEQAFNVLIHGRSGCGKTSRAREVQNLFCGSICDDQQLMTWKDSVNAISKYVEQAGDCFFLVDEFRYSSKRQLLSMLNLLQGVAQGGGRTTLTQSRDIREGKSSSCILATTMEVLPDTDDAMLSRSIIIEVPHVDLLDPCYKEPHDNAMKMREVLPYAMSSWVTWFMGDSSEGRDSVTVTLKESKDIAERLCRYTADTNNAGWRSRPNAPRIYGRAITISWTWRLMLNFARSLDSITSAEAEMLWDEWSTDVLPKYFEDIFGRVDGSGIPAQVADAIASGLFSGDCYFSRRSLAGGEVVGGCRLPQKKDNASEIGVIIPSPKLQEEDAIEWQGEKVIVILKQPLRTLLMRAGIDVSWKMLQRVMANYGLGAEKMIRTEKDRGISLTKKGHQEILQPYLNALPR